MRLVLLAIGSILVAPAVHAQFSDKPDSWSRLEGHFQTDFQPSDAFFLRNLCLAHISQSKSSITPGTAVADLAELADRALVASNRNAAARLYARLLTVLRGRTPGEWLEVAHSLDFQLDRRIAAPGTLVHARLSPTFLLDGPLSPSYSVRLSIAHESGKPTLDIPSPTLDRLAEFDLRIPTANLAPGHYLVRYQLLDKAGATLAAAARPLLLDPTLPRRIAALEAQADSLAASGVAAKSARHAAAFETIQFTAGLYRRATREPVASFHQSLHPLLLTLSSSWPQPDSTDPISPPRDLTLAESLASALLKDADPLSSLTGDLRLAYRSGVEKPFQPFRVFVPPNYNPTRKWPLILALRSETGDEGSLFDLCPPGQESLLLKLARDRGYLVVSPEGLGPYSYFVGTSADDAFLTINRVKAIYSIDDAQLFVAGNAMGAIGATTLSLDPRARFAAIAAVAAKPIQPNDYTRAPDIPLLLLQPSSSPLLPLREARAVGFALARRFKRLDYDELPGQDHFTAFPAALPRIFDCFDAVRAGSWKPSGKPIPLSSSAPSPR